MPSSDDTANILWEHGEEDGEKLFMEAEISEIPGLTIWKEGDVRLFDAGFSGFTGCLREITMGMKDRHTSNDCGDANENSREETSKSMKDVVDYHYRFKITEQYRKFMDKSDENQDRPDTTTYVGGNMPSHDPNETTESRWKRR